MTAFRVAAHPAGPPLRFSFDGRAYTGVAGDTLASALLANGVHLMGRSFKYHRPRGLLGAGSEEPNALVEVDRGPGRRTPNLRATGVELYDGLVARSQNRFPSLRFDLGAAAGLAAPVLSAGFYYKTFLWPPKAWARLYEPLIRRAAGLGRAPDRADPDHYAQQFAYCDVLVVGGGPAGLAAARAAAADGARVILCDEQPAFGGALLSERHARIDGLSAADWVRGMVAALAAMPEVRLLPRTTAFGHYGHNLVGLVQRVTDHLPDPDPALPRERLWQVRAGKVVVAAGSIERPLVFPGNDRPGVMLAGAAATYANRYGVRPGRRAVLLTQCDTAYRDALDLREAGVEVAVIADLRPEASGPLPDAARAAGIRIVTGARVHGTAGRLRVRQVHLAWAGGRERVAADLVCMAGGWTPSLHLYAQARGKPRFDAAIGAFVPGDPVPGLVCAGAAEGTFGLADVLRGSSVEDAPPSGWAPVVAPPQPGRAFVDFQNDVTAKDLALAAREGFRSIEHVKRYTTAGMATDQGKTSNINALDLVAAALGTEPDQVGLTTYRPPYTPVTFGALAGLSRGTLFDPVRTTPMHDQAEAAGAVFEDVGNWKRARFFPRPGETMPDAVARECRTVREAVGMFDASTLGKIEVVGEDAAEFLERMYVNAWKGLKPGRCRYGVMLGENGFVLDDGVVGRLSPGRYHVTAGTGHVARVLGLMEDYLQTEWPDLKVWLTPTTEQWAVISVQGPRSRAAIAPLVEGADLAMPHMSLAECRVLGVPARLFRVSFTGEMGWEINVPAGHGPAVWEAVAHQVAAQGGCPYGTEAGYVLRAEKGYVLIGQETDGTVTPGDLGLDWAIGKKKPDFVGKRSLATPDLAAPGRRQLVGLAPERAAFVLEEGMQVSVPGQPRPIGHVTSAYAAGTAGSPVVLALVADGRARLGGQVGIDTPSGTVAATVIDPVRVDPAGVRLNA